eukprot:COSAG03_NODE_580_length_6871_cov_10.166716_4_plen_513_part_00
MYGVRCTLQALRLGTPGGGSASGALQPLMATEPVGRSRIRSDEVVVPGHAIPRMCHGEEDEEWLAQRDHLVEECERAIDMFVKRWDALQRHANWDRRQGQPFVVECKNGRFTLPKRFKSIVTGVGPSAKDEDEDEDKDGVLVDASWDGYAKGRSVSDSAVSDGPGSTQRIALRLPPTIYPSRDKHALQVLHQLRKAFTPQELDILIAPPGFMSSGACQGYIPRVNASSQLRKQTYRPQRFGAGGHRKYQGIVNDIECFAASRCQSSVERPFNRCQQFVGGMYGFWNPDSTTDEDKDFEVVDSSDEDREERPEDLYASMVKTWSQTDSAELQRQWDYWMPEVEKLAWHGHAKKLWANRDHNSFRLHGSRYCVVIDTQSRSRRGGNPTHSIDFLCHTDAQGLGHGRKTVHLVIERLLREHPERLVVANVAALKESLNGTYGRSRAVKITTRCRSQRCPTVCLCRRWRMLILHVMTLPDRVPEGDTDSRSAFMSHLDDVYSCVQRNIDERMSRRR